ncbi:hypothetical protein HO173_006610 [Letharia columbiana]|uniref:Protein kinase domain-containing protein n=1 Tax=Letharia columbiana TaxID=112416 RepID=A0A8H6FVD7_9LECA|nr:uncharacterized protein HO173_006610 [Letharia columbiana]KAF6235414.1 hypothetical protein HO173_006610 [Letharia columbiana]
MTAWWSNERISTTVNAAYIKRELGSKDLVDKVHRVLAFGDGLTDDTYLDWILERSPRFFLILNVIGVPEKVFEIIDKSFADDDLPLSQDTLWELNLFGGKSETLDRKFHREQFNFLIQELEPGGHVDYGDWAVVPVEPFVKRPGIAKANDKVYVHGNLYTRKKIAVFDDNSIDEVQFIMHLKSLSTVRHPHLVSIWSTYSQESFIYVLLTPATEHTLKSFLEEQPKAFKNFDKAQRREIYLTWTHCLAAALAYLHDRGFTHETIRPGTITVDHNNKIYLGDHSALKKVDTDESPNAYNGELYDHAAPENWLRKPRLHEVAALKTILPGGGRTSRRIPKAPSAERTTSLPLPSTPVNSTRTNSKSGSSGSSTNASRPRNALITTFAPTERRTSISSSISPRNSKLEAADVFSLTTVLITLLSMILQHTPKTFATHRSRLNRQAGRGNAPPDASFHKNLNQVVKWLDILAKEAGQREKKDMKFWGAVVETVQLCRLGVKKEAKERITAKELEYKIGGWVEWGLGRKRRCTCEVARDTGVQPDTRSSAEFSSKFALDQPSSGRRPSRPDWLPASERGRSFPESRPRSADAAKQSTVWGLGDLATLHENMMRPASVMTFEDSTAWGLEHGPYMDRDNRGSASIISGKESTVWGLGDAQRMDDEDRHTIGRKKSDASATDSCIAMGEVEVLEGYDIDDDEDDDDEEYENVLYEKGGRSENWPLPHLPPEMLALGRGKAKEMDGHRDLRRIGAMGIQDMG